MLRPVVEIDWSSEGFNKRIKGYGGQISRLMVDMVEFDGGVEMLDFHGQVLAIYCLHCDW